jgi:hypothetical protein
LFSKLYAAAAAKLINHLVARGRPFLPGDTWLNVNFPRYNSTGCSKVSDVKFVMTRIADNDDNGKACGSLQLPTELSIVLGQGCYCSVSVGDAVTKKAASPSIQRQVMAKLDGLLTHVPSA